LKVSPNDIVFFIGEKPCNQPQQRLKRVLAKGAQLIKLVGFIPLNIDGHAETEASRLEKAMGKDLHSKWLTSLEFHFIWAEAKDLHKAEMAKYCACVGEVNSHLSELLTKLSGDIQVFLNPLSQDRQKTIQALVVLCVVAHQQGDLSTFEYLIGHLEEQYAITSVVVSTVVWEELLQLAPESTYATYEALIRAYAYCPQGILDREKAIRLLSTTPWVYPPNKSRALKSLIRLKTKLNPTNLGEDEIAFVSA